MKRTAILAAAALLTATVPVASAAATPSRAPLVNGDLLVTINGNLYLLNPDGTNRRQLTSSGHISDAQFSPDGSRIAFARGQNRRTDLFVMRADGTGVTRLTTTPDVDENNPSWSPDARRIAFTRDVVDANRGDGIAIMAARPGAAATVVKRNVYRPDHADIYKDPKWAPTGGWLAIMHYQAEEGSCSPLWVERITPTGADVGTSFRGYDPDIDPTGTWVAATGEECDTNPWVVKQNVTTGRKLNVTNKSWDPYESDPVWSPTGGRIAYQLGRYQAGGGYTSELYVANADGSGAKRLIGNTAGSIVRPRDWRAR